MIYDINNLVCKYKTGAHPALVIKDLQIFDTERVFFIGSSGVGKSTILETLGFMNNTIEKADRFTFNHSLGEENMLEVWKKSESYLSNIRNSNLSFIFQVTNLFTTLNAEDNVLLTLLLQGTSKIQAVDKIRKTVRKIFPEKYKEILNNKKIVEMSGGQRQRLAFVRAICSQYKILFADEPTGNLDKGLAEKVMNHLSEDIIDKSATAIVVSHDINLSVKHATKIVFIEKKEGEGVNLFNSIEEKFNYGEINFDNIYKKQENGKWINQADYGGRKPPEFSDSQLVSILEKNIRS